LSLVVLRGRLFEELPTGAMLGVSVSDEDARSLIGDKLSIAAINGPRNCVVSGAIEAVEEMEQALTEKDIDYRRLQIEVAAHSAMVEPILNRFSSFLKTIHFAPPRIPYLSNVTGTWITSEQATDPEYWRLHLRQTVRFSQGLSELVKAPHRLLLEVGPGNMLSSLAKLQASPSTVFSSIRHPRDRRSDLAFLLTTLGDLWTAGIEINWDGFSAGERRRRIALPTYPFERTRHWIESRRGQ
jgi:acyl transferase domain-containing protein